MNRMGRGYSFDVIRARLIYDDKARQPTRKTVRSRVQVLDDMDKFALVTASPSPVRTKIVETTVEYGPHIPTLCKLLESGHFE